ncbi:MAG: type I methionyl aminopeptidase [Chloroflexi bacterium]|nr:type I methionyl aminopeptidase [Chloroflexota bacterium]|tara:strand:- start:25424 stop:26173 length:750 start_codon:yes stop_codon:yes gene_type:complete
MISLKSNAEIKIMKEAGKIVAIAVRKAFDVMQPGITTKELDNIASEEIKNLGAQPAFLGLYGFPATACISINSEIVHGIPSEDRIVNQGDIVTIDCGAIVDGFYSDHAVSEIAGNADEDSIFLVDTTKKSLLQAIDNAKPGNRLGDISNAVETYVRPKGFELVREYVGHGIGRQLHESPQVPNIGQPSTGIELKPGLVLAIEPMLTVGSWETEKLEDDWTVVTKDGSMSCHFEHTVAVTENGPEVLTEI